MARVTIRWYINGTVERGPFTTSDGRILIRMGPNVNSVYLKTQGTTAYNNLRDGWHTIAPGTYVPGLMGIVSPDPGYVWTTIDYK